MQAPQGRFCSFQSRAEVNEDHELHPRRKNRAFFHLTTSGGAAKRLRKKTKAFVLGAQSSERRKQRAIALALSISHTCAASASARPFCRFQLLRELEQEQKVAQEGPEGETEKENSRKRARKGLAAAKLTLSLSPFDRRAAPAA